MPPPGASGVRFGAKGGLPPLFFTDINATFQRNGERRVEQGATTAESQLLARVKNGAVGGVVGNLAELGDLGDRLLQGHTTALITVFDR